MVDSENTLNLKPKRPQRAPQNTRNAGLESASSENPILPERNQNNSKRETLSQSIKSREEKTTEPRIGFGVGTLMFITALFFDSAQGVLNVIGLIPLIGNIIGASLSFMIGFFAWLTFYTWFKMHGISFIRPKRLIALLGAGIVELVPYLNALPAWTFAVLFLIATTRIEDKTGINPTKLIKPTQSGNVSKAA